MSNTTLPVRTSTPPSTFPSVSLLSRTLFPQTLSSTDHTISVTLTYSPLSPTSVLASIRSPTAGANVLFLGTTRDSFASRPVLKLSYSAYPALALKSFLAIAEAVKRESGLERVTLVHRLGDVGVGEESIAVAVSAGHRGAAWRGAEEALERCKARVEIWKCEVLGDVEGESGMDGKGTNGVEEVWRANREWDREGREKDVNGDVDGEVGVKAVDGNVKRDGEVYRDEETHQLEEKDKNEYWRNLGLAS